MNLPAKAGAGSECPEYLWPEIRWGMRSRNFRNACRLLAGLILLALPCAAQLQVGNNLNMNLSGNVGFTYAGTDNQNQSGHSMGFSGNGNLTGSSYRPN